MITFNLTLLEIVERLVCRRHRIRYDSVDRAWLRAAAIAYLQEQSK